MGDKPVLPALPEPFKYPEGVIESACVCGSWPGGPCLQCKIVRPYIAEQMDAHGLACYRKAIEDAALVCDTRAGLADREEQLSSLDRSTYKPEILHRGIRYGARECAAAIRALGGAIGETN